MRNIAIFIPTIKSGGAEKQATLLAESLSKQYNVYFVSFYGLNEASNDNIKRLSACKVTTCYLQGNLFSKLIEFRNILKKNDISVVFNYLTFCDVVGSILEYFSGVKNIYNGIRCSSLPKIKLITERIVHNSIVTKTIYNSFYGAKCFEKYHFDKNKTIVIQNCFNNISDPIHRNERKVKTIISVGRFVHAKDYFTALKVIACIRQKRNDFKYLIVGYGDLESQIRQWIETLNISDVVSIKIRPNNIPDLLHESDIYLSTSISEGTSNSIMEAMDKSLPVVATMVGDNDKLIDNKITGYICNVRDITNLSNSISLLLDNYEQRIKMGLKGHSKLCSEYNQNIFLDNYLKLL